MSATPQSSDEKREKLISRQARLLSRSLKKLEKVAKRTIDRRRSPSRTVKEIQIIRDSLSSYADSDPRFEALHQKCTQTIERIASYMGGRYRHEEQHFAE